MRLGGLVKEAEGRLSGGTRGDQEVGGRGVDGRRAEVVVWRSEVRGDGRMWVMGCGQEGPEPL